MKANKRIKLIGFQGNKDVKWLNVVNLALFLIYSKGKRIRELNMESWINVYDEHVNRCGTTCCAAGEFAVSFDCSSVEYFYTPTSIVGKASTYCHSILDPVEGKEMEYFFAASHPGCEIKFGKRVVARFMEHEGPAIKLKGLSVMGKLIAIRKHLLSILDERFGECVPCLDKWKCQHVMNKVGYREIAIGYDDYEEGYYHWLSNGKRVVFGQPTNNCFLESGYIDRVDGESIEDTVAVAEEDLKRIAKGLYPIGVIHNERV